MSNNETEVSEPDFEIVDASLVQGSKRERKSSYKGVSFTPSHPVSQYYHYRALQSNYRRRHKTMETPWDHFIDPLMEREDEYAKVFPVTLIELRLMVKEEENAKANAKAAEAKYYADKRSAIDNTEVECENCGETTTCGSAVEYSSHWYDDKYICEDCDDLSIAVCLECGDTYDTDDDDVSDEFCENCYEEE